MALKTYLTFEDIKTWKILSYTKNKKNPEMRNITG